MNILRNITIEIGTLMDVKDIENHFQSNLLKPLPSTLLRLGSAEAEWALVGPNDGVLFAEKGTYADKILAIASLSTILRESGVSIVKTEMPSIQPGDVKTAGWDDIMAKAKRIIQAGNVQLLRNGANNIVAYVQGDHGNYQVEIGRDDPNSQAITTWSCDCPWAQYSWGRTRKWKKYEGRPCAHTLATYWKSLATPLDEARDPGQSGPPSPIIPPTAPPTAPSPFQAPVPGSLPGQATGTPPMPSVTPPPGPGIIPPYPIAPDPNAPQVNPASVPGQRQPSPTNPVQYPGGTFSSVTTEWQTTEMDRDFVKQAGFGNGQIVSTKSEDYGVLVGRSEEHGSGQQVKIPPNSVGEVIGEDPTTGMVQVLFMGGQFESYGKLEPYGATAWFFPSEIVLREDIKAPGPAVRRRK